MTLQQLVDFVHTHEAFLLTAHETPDGDAIGAEVALAAALNALGKRVTVLNTDPTPATFEFLDKEGQIVALQSKDDLPDELASHVLFLLDVTDPNNIGVVRDWVMPYVRSWVCIDHHENEQPDGKDYIVSNASSTCEIVHGLIDALGVELTPQIAEALYVGIVYDTGSFVYPKTSAETFRIGHRLVQAGVTPYEVYTRVYESNTVSSLVLQTRVMATMEFHFNHAVAIQTMTRGTLESCGASYEEGQRLINIPLTAEAVRVSIFFKESEDGLVRCSLRSKGELDVAEVARRFRGGGHLTAAGFKLTEPLEVTKQEVLKLLHPHFSNRNA